MEHSNSATQIDAVILDLCEGGTARAIHLPQPSKCKRTRRRESSDQKGNENQCKNVKNKEADSHEFHEYSIGEYPKGPGSGCPDIDTDIVADTGAAAAC